MLITLMDVESAEEVDFNDWYDKEHLAERVGIEGFTEARRYVAKTGTPKYLNLYTTKTFDVLDSPAYRKVLANQTARSTHHIERFLNAGRAIVRIMVSRGQGRGSAVFFAAIRPSAQKQDQLRALLDERLTALIPQHGIISAHLVESDPQLSKPLTETVPPPSASDWYVIIDGADTEVVGRAGKELIGDAGIAAAGAVVSHGVYQLIWDLSKAEL